MYELTLINTPSRALKSHALGVRHTHFNPFTRSHAKPCISHAKKITRVTVRSHQKRTKRKMIPEVIHCVLGARRTKREKRNRRTRVDLAT